MGIPFVRRAVAWPVLALCLGSTACAPLTPQPVGAASVRAQAAPAQFQAAGRFTLKLEAGPRAGQYAGRFEWGHRPGLDDLFLATPLGQGILAVQVSPEETRVQNAKGETRTAPSPEALIQAELGYPLPLGDLARWLLGDAGAQGRVARDAAGRPVSLVDQGWRMSYGYDGPDRTLPDRVDFLREGEMELRLRIETWEE